VKGTQWERMYKRGDEERKKERGKEREKERKEERKGKLKRRENNVLDQ